MSSALRDHARARVGAVAGVLLLLSPLGGLLQELPDARPPFSPPALAAVRAIGWRASVRDTAVLVGSGGAELEALLGGDADGAPRAAPSGPHVSHRPTPVVRAGTPFRYVFASPHGPVTALVLEGAPSGLTVDSATGIVSGVPTIPGRYTVTIQGTVADTLRVTQQFELDVTLGRHLLGTDGQGRDLLRRLVQSGPLSLPPALLAMLVCVVGGGGLGALAGFHGGRLERVMTLLLQVLQGVPPLLMVFLVAAATDLSLPAMMVVAGLFLVPETADGIRLRVRALRQRDFVEASRELGLPDSVILWRELVWHNCRLFVLTRASQAVIYALLVGVLVAYLGAVKPDSPQLGALLKDGLNNVSNYPVLFAAPTLWLMGLITAIRLVEGGVAERWRRRR